MNYMQDDWLVIIFSFGSYETIIKNAMQVCKRWNHLISKRVIKILYTRMFGIDIMGCENDIELLKMSILLRNIRYDSMFNDITNYTIDNCPYKDVSSLINSIGTGPPYSAAIMEIEVGDNISCIVPFMAIIYACKFPFKKCILVTTTKREKDSWMKILSRLIDISFISKESDNSFALRNNTIIYIYAISQVLALGDDDLFCDYLFANTSGLWDKRLFVLSRNQIIFRLLSYLDTKSRIIYMEIDKFIQSLGVTEFLSILHNEQP